MYDSSLKYKWDNKNVLDYAVATAEARGFEKGLEMAKEFEKAIEKGKYQKAVAVASEMKKEGMHFTQISKFTKLSVEEIEKL